MPDSFYKYMSFSTAKIVLENQTLRWTTPSTLNDPYDIQFDLNVIFDRKKVLADTLEKSWKVYQGHLECSKENKMYEVMNLLREHCKGMPKDHFYKTLSKGITESFKVLDRTIASTYATTREILSTSKILCLTDSPTNQLMWAYYADSNRGAVLQFSQEPGADSPYKMAKPIKYKKELPKLFEEDELSDFLSGIIAFDQQKRVDDLIYTKSDAWTHEREWRIYTGNGRDKLAPHEDIKFGHRELTSVILGCRMSEADKTELSLCVNRLYPHAEIVTASLANHSYQIELTPVNAN
ncbi:DUF2971 domain-containing protein [Pseudomonas reactans]|uniref:DUF2971 domain-containing protein n=1 Tax=Pseudomonas reactans TaxID=117680 RepID=UPI0015A2F976|nr:DUF2971 domain-containing protein [Pseudomonas reactans]NWA66738.1 DUF2971 domain-containing protein [Pseudomonas reactans]